ncbi:hypothetical protein IFM89_008804 [Coptis chinensis]|uniref:FBD domain-containing protein n=1 Tax=Coptis chinensis TaxID=261450 RepID=A0A835GVY6_9MAGN|nr:hypothetical protein IFM89_008804 [Coptis chinensis]
MKVLSNDAARIVTPALQFVNLRCLKLQTWLYGDCIHAITCLLNTSPNLETLSVKVLLDWVSPPNEYEDTGLPLQRMYHLKSFEFQGFLWQPRANNGLTFVEILLKNGVVLEKMVLSHDAARIETSALRFVNLRCMKLQTWLYGDCIHAITCLLNNSPNLETLGVEVLCVMTYHSARNLANITVVSPVMESNDGQVIPVAKKVLSKPAARIETLDLQFVSLRYIKLQTWLYGDCIRAIIYLLNCSPNLETLSVEVLSREIFVNCTEWYENWVSPPHKYKDTGLPLQCMYHLNSFEFQGFLGHTNGLKFVEILLNNAVVLEKMVFSISKERDLTIKHYLGKFQEKLQHLPRASSVVETFFL